MIRWWKNLDKIPEGRVKSKDTVTLKMASPALEKQKKITNNNTQTELWSSNV